VSEVPTKERILDAAEEIMLERGFHAVGLNQILSAVKVPKGSFYHYFDSKEQFGVEMLRHYANESNARKRSLLLDSDVEENPIERLFALFDLTVGKFQENGGKCPCLMLKLAAEVANFSDSMREELVKSFIETTSIVQQALDQAVAKGLLAESFDTASEAGFILDLWTGAQQRAAIFRKVTPLRRAMKIFAERLKTPS